MGSSPTSGTFFYNFFFPFSFVFASFLMSFGMYMGAHNAMNTHFKGIFPCFSCNFSVSSLFYVSNVYTTIFSDYLNFLFSFSITWIMKVIMMMLIMTLMILIYMITIVMELIIIICSTRKYFIPSWINEMKQIDNSMNIKVNTSTFLEYLIW